MKNELELLLGTNLFVSLKNGMLYRDGKVINHMEFITIHNYPIRYNVELFLSLILHKIKVTPMNVKYLSILNVVKVGKELSKRNFKMYFKELVKYDTELGDDYYVSPMNINLAFNNHNCINVNEGLIHHINTNAKPWGYVQVSVYGHSYTLFILKGYALLKAPKNIKHEFVIDHIDRNKRNDDISNLRFVTQSGNTLGPNNKNNDGKGFKVEVLNLETNERITYHSLRKFMKAHVAILDSSYIYTPLKHGPYQGKYIWVMNDEFELTLKETMDRYCYALYDVYKDDVLIETLYNKHDVINKYIDVVTFSISKIGYSRVVDKLSKLNKEFTFSFRNGSEVKKLGGRNLSNKSFEAYNPLTKEKIVSETLRGLSKELKEHGTNAINQIRKGPYYVHSNGYIIREVGSYENKVEDYSPKLNIYRLYEYGKLIEETSSIRMLCDITGIDRNEITYKIDNRLDIFNDRYKIEYELYEQKLIINKVDYVNK